MTDLAALGDLSRWSHAAGDERSRAVRSLGLPVAASQMSVFSLFRMPLGALQPHDPLYVYEEDGRLAGLARVETNDPRDEWTIVELDAVDQDARDQGSAAGDVRYRLVQHLLRDGGKRGCARFHVACADEGGNVELFMQHGFARYGEELILHRPGGQPWPPVPADAELARLGIHAMGPVDALDLGRLYALVTPTPVARLEDYRLADWERGADRAQVPRSSLTPILRFADAEAFVQRCPPGGPSGASDELVAFLQVGVSKTEQPHYLRVISRPEHDAASLIRFGLAVIGARSGEATRRPSDDTPRRGVIATVRTYESPLERRLEDQGFQRVAQVSLLMKETLVRVADPAFLPATTR
ncbi:MAG: GNAT family N-acetyltransferase [Chloroflexota bacterium]